MSDDYVVSIPVKIRNVSARCAREYLYERVIHADSPPEAFAIFVELLDQALHSARKELWETPDSER